MLVRLVCLAILLLARPALAQAVGEAPQTCVPKGALNPTYESESQRIEWPQEAPRLRVVARRTGRLFAVHGAPVWATDKRRFLTVACSLQPARGTLSVFAPSDEGLASEAEFELPCDSESCSARWDFQSWISIACTPRDDTAKKGQEFVLMRGNDGKWNRFGR